MTERASRHDQAVAKHEGHLGTPRFADIGEHAHPTARVLTTGDGPRTRAGPYHRPGGPHLRVIGPDGDLELSQASTLPPTDRVDENRCLETAPPSMGGSRHSAISSMSRSVILEMASFGTEARALVLRDVRRDLTRGQASPERRVRV